MLDKPTSEVDENQIDLDINRTLRNHIVYRQRYGPGQQRLFNVLRAYANYDTEVGFCQGMASVAAFLLIYCKEETTFFIMEKLVSHPTFRLRGLWISGFPMLMEGFYVHDRMLKYHLPRLYKHFVMSLFFCERILVLTVGWTEKTQHPPELVRHTVVHDHLPGLPLPHVPAHLGRLFAPRL